MAIEKYWLSVPAQLLSANGGKYGQVVVPSTAFIKTKQKVILQSNLIVPTTLEVKRVTSATTFEVGRAGQGIKDRSDLTMFLTAQNATLQAEEQARPPIANEDTWRAVYEEEPTVALRTILVDTLGNRYNDDNPLPVAFSGSVALGNVGIVDEDGDRVEVNADGSINVNIVDAITTPELLISQFSEVTLVASGAPTNIVSYTVPVGKTLKLSKMEFGGSNIGTYEVLVDGIIIARKRTNFATDISGFFNFEGPTSKGVTLTAGQIIRLRVTHARPYVGDFEGRLQALLLG